MSAAALLILAVVHTGLLLHVGQPHSSAAANPIAMDEYQQLLRQAVDVSAFATMSPDDQLSLTPASHNHTMDDGVTSMTWSSVVPTIVMVQFHEYVLQQQQKRQKRAAKMANRQRLPPHRPQKRRRHRRHSQKRRHHKRERHRWRNEVFIYTQNDDTSDQRFADRPDLFHFRFDVNDIPASHNTTTAALQVSWNTTARAVAAANGTNGTTTTAVAPTNCTIAVYDILRPGAQYKLIADQNVSSDAAFANSSCLELDVFGAVQRWRKQPQAMFGLAVQIDCADGGVSAEHQLLQHIRLRREPFETEASWAQHQPTLTVRTKTYIRVLRHRPEETVLTVTVTRHRRTVKGAATAATGPLPAIAPAAPAASAPASAAAALPASNTTVSARLSCRLHPMYVDFAAIGWADWIIAPPGYDGNICTGQCRQPRNQHPTTHALVQAETHRLKPERAPAPCCVPIRYDPITVMYMGNKGQFRQTEFAHMVVTQCGCR